jgi:two-component system sensor histidine kinase DegS
VVKHARAANVGVKVRKKDRGLQIIVEDDGVGFDVDESRAQFSRTDGFGLFSIRERLDHFEGCVEIISKAGEGTRITVSVPLTVKGKK